MRTLAITLVLATLIAGCGDETLPQGAPGQPGQPAPAAPGAKGAPGKPGGPGAAAVPSNLPPLPVRDIQERDFLESPTSRDPFHSYADQFAVKVATVDASKVTREVLVGKYALEELKVNGIITGGTPRAMVTDPSGLGWILRVGDFVGKSEVLQSGGATGSDVAVNWRVDRIRENDIVFVREDPSRPDVQATTRVLSLRSRDEMKPEIRTGIRGSRPEDNPTEGDAGKSKKAAPAPAPASKGGGD
ncbi:MAG: pilus assembly protein PilP [Polyangiaceae bacterium]|nr:pilus assembly protein PilP [Polyangiaceae bacterium]